MTKAALLATFLTIVCQLHVRGQEQVNQSLYAADLKKELAITRDEAKKDTLLGRLADAYVYYKPDSALFYARQRIQLAQKINSLGREADATGYYGHILALMANYPQAVKYLLEGLEMAKKAKDSTKLDWFYDALSNTFIDQGNFDLALSYANQFRDISIRNKDTLFYGWLLTKGVVYEKFGYLDSAFFFLRKAFDFDVRTSGEITRERTVLSLGNAYFKKGSFPEALQYYRMAMNLAIQKENYINLVEAFNGVAQLYNHTGQLDSAIYYATEALRMSQFAYYTLGQLAANTTLADVYKKKGDREETLSYLEATIALKDSLFNQQKERAVQNLFFNDRMRERDLAETERQLRNKWRTYGLVTGVLVLLVLAGILYRNNRNKQRAYALLQQQKAETDQARGKAEQALEDLKEAQMQLIQREKMASLGELTAGIAHEIQNPLNFVNNFAEANKELLTDIKQELTQGNYDEVTAIVQDLEVNEEKIIHHGKRADSIVKGMLQHSKSATGEKEPTDLNALVGQYLQLAYHGYRTRNKAFTANLSTCYDQTIGNVNLIPEEMGRVLLNLFNNAFYAVSKKKEQLNGAFEPVVSVSTKRVNNIIQIVVEDNGTGMPINVVEKVFQPFFTTKPTGEGIGLGLSLSYDIVTKRHGGTLAVQSIEGEGSEFAVVLPG
jgi:two-component system, NtrC family, sensor kinase